MTEDNAGRRPPGPPPSWLGAGLPTAPIPSGAAEQNEPTEVVRPAGGARGPMGRVGNVIGALVAVTALVAIVFVFGRPYVAQWFGGGGESSALGEGGVYDFTQTVSTESPLGPMPEITIRVPDGLASVVPGYADGRYLDAVTVSNVQYLESRDEIFVMQPYCSADIAFDWHEGVLERELADSTVGGVNPVDAEKVARLAGLSLERFDAFEFSPSDNWSKATVTAQCYDPAQFDGSGWGASMSFDFKYAVTNGKGDQEVKRLAGAPVVLTSNGKVFIVEGAMEPNLQGWSVDGDGQWSEAYGQ